VCQTTAHRPLVRYPLVYLDGTERDSVPGFSAPRDLYFFGEFPEKDKAPRTVAGPFGVQTANLGSLPHNWLGAMRAAAGIKGNLAEAFRTLFGGRIGRSGIFAGAGNQGVDRGDDEEVHGAGDEQEADDGGDEIADGKYGGADGEADTGEVGFADEQGNDGVDDVFYECGHDGAERSADDDADGEVNNVATQYELLKAR